MDLLVNNVEGWIRISTAECEMLKLRDERPDLKIRTGKIYDVILEIGSPRSQQG